MRAPWPANVVSQRVAEVLTRDELRDRAADPLIVAVAADGVLLSGRASGPLRHVRVLPSAVNTLRAAAGAAAPAVASADG